MGVANQLPKGKDKRKDTEIPLPYLAFVLVLVWLLL